MSDHYVTESEVCVAARVDEGRTPRIVATTGKHCPSLRVLLNDVLRFRISYIATPGLCGTGISHQLAAHGSVLFATARYLSADYVGWQVYLSPEVIEKTIAIVAELGSGNTFLSDYVRTPIKKKDSKFSAIETPGPVAKALLDFLLEQHKTELNDFPSLLKIG